MTCLQVDRALADLVLGMLQLDAMRRLTAAAALLHPFFDAVSPMRALMQVRLHCICPVHRCWTPALYNRSALFLSV